MTEISATDPAPVGQTAKRWLTPLLITAYIVAVLLISGLSRAKNEQAVAGSIGESSTVSASVVDAPAVKIRR